MENKMYAKTDLCNHYLRCGHCYERDLCEDELKLISLLQRIVDFKGFMIIVETNTFKCIEINDH